MTPRLAFLATFAAAGGTAGIRASLHRITRRRRPAHPCPCPCRWHQGIAWDPITGGHR